ncbi:MAG: UDP-N-acetylglucosamine 2-epimerase (hydrolyzing) [Lachnospiraceae bacterium]|nr:UDP-N-acetylglucosamine 2-epimerase (hydrolyzing) [Lachnospiraceae bacterium]
MSEKKVQKKHIAIATSARADYGILKPLIERLKQEEAFETGLLVTGMHLCESFGTTVQEIERDGNPISARIPILKKGDSARNVSETMANTLRGFAEYFAANRPDLLIVLGDRYEIMAVCIAAVNEGIPIAHLHGGETTEGAIDECVRHAITKMSYLHFTATEKYRERVIQLGEAPERVFAVGALGVENICRLELMKENELRYELGLTDLPYISVTFHPVTMEQGQAEKQVRELLAAMDEFAGKYAVQYVVTKANADAGGRGINRMLEEYDATRENVHLYTSLGMYRYLSSLKYCTFVLGNSSSGIIEAPSFGVPTVNIGDRQRGRIQAESVINCKPEKKEILSAMDRAMSKKWQEHCRRIENPYGKGDTSERIVEVLKDYLLNGKISLKKSFYDIDGVK